MPATQQVATLLVLTSQAAEAERLVASLRNGGLVVREIHSTSTDSIEELLQRHACDLIVCCGYDPGIDLEGLLELYRDLDTDLSLIVIADPDSEPQTIIQALRAGAHNVVERYDQGHLQLAVGRELADLHQRRQAQRLTRELQQCEERGRELIESSGEAIAFVQQGLHLHANAAYLGLFGLPGLEDLESTTFLDLIEAEQRRSVRELLRERETTSQSDRVELATTCVRADASRFRALLIAAPSELEGETCVRIIVRDLADESSQSEHGPARRAVGPGYRGLIASIQARIGPDGRAQGPFGLLCARVRNSPDLMRELGLSRGLDVIGSLEAPLREVVGGGALIARISDEGYAVLVDALDQTGAKSLARRIRTEVRLAGPGTGGSRIEPELDVGYVLAEGPTAPAVGLLDHAYRACFAGPTAKRPEHTTSLATRSKQVAEEGDDAMAAKIEYALANDRFLLVYQPIVSLLGDNQENYSVLVRLIDGDSNLLEAHEFIGPAIRHGLIEQIDKWAIRQAVKAMGRHRRGGHKLNFFINLAEDAFQDSGIIVWICDCLRELDVRGSWLTFVFQEELVEGSLGGAGNLSKLIEALKKIKCRVAVNRFGATAHPQALFQGIPLDFVLLQPDFARGLADDRDKQHRLLSLANLAREYNVKSVVTGVEDARALTILWTAGVDYVQGNFLQRPSPTLEIAT